MFFIFAKTLPLQHFICANNEEGSLYSCTCSQYIFRRADINVNIYISRRIGEKKFASHILPEVILKKKSLLPQNAGKKVYFAGNLLPPPPINIKWPLPYTQRHGVHMLQEDEMGTNKDWKGK